MARINYPEDFTAQTALLSKIAKQNAALGTKSPLIVYCREHDLNFAELAGLAEPATEQNNQHLAIDKSSENNTQQRNNKFGPAWKNLTLEVQFLKHFYKGSERKLGDWSITVDGTGKIVYPPDFAARAQLVQDFLRKHNSYPPGESPLQLFIDEHDIDVAKDGEATAAAIGFNNDKDEQEAAAKMATQQRNTIWQPALDAIHAFGAFLMGLYAEDSRKMGAWGYDVVEEAAGETVRTTKLKPAAEKTNSSVAIGSVFTNTGKTDLLLDKGDEITDAAVTLKPGEEMGMIKGYSIITVRNLSTLANGEFTVGVSSR